MRWQIIYSCLLLIASYSLNGQLDSAAKAEVIKSLSLFRSELLKDTNNVIAYGVVVHENAKLNWDSLNYRHTFYVNENLLFNYPENNRRNLINRYGSNNILTQMNIDLQKINYDNRYLESAINYGLVENAYPFNLNKKLNLFEELNFYNIKANDTILDFDSGLICFAPLLCSIYSDLIVNLFIPYYYNEEFKEKYIIQRFNCFKVSSRIEFITYKFKNKSISPLKFNNLFLTSPIGYYDSPIKIFKNATQLMRADGHLYFAQYKVWKFNQCIQPYKYSANKLNRILSKSGLKIIDTLTLESKTIYKCAKINSN